MEITSKDRSVLLTLVRKFESQRLVVLADLVADQYLVGDISRISREAPVLILKQRDSWVLPGGGANAANNLVDLGARVTLVGLVGEDKAGDALCRYFENKAVSLDHVIRLSGYRTPTKSRILGVLGHGHPQQIARLDREPQAGVALRARRELSRHVAAQAGTAKGLLVSDYGYEAVEAREIKGIQQALGHSVPVAVDSRFRLRSYSGVTALTPNEFEMEEAFHQPVTRDRSALDRLAARVLRRQALQSLLVTRGREGMVLYERGREPQSLAIFGSDEVADVTGAGDTVIAVFALGLAAGASFLRAAMLANCAGGLVVMKKGTATVTSPELAEAIRNA